MNPLIAHDIDGSGPCVVLLHSAVVNRRMWTRQWQALRTAGYRVLRADMRGYGDTPPATTEFTYARDVCDLLDAYGIERAAVVGSSLGGRIAQEVASRWPDRVSDLVLLCSARRLHPPTPAIIAFSERLAALLDSGDIDGATELTVTAHLGPAADPATRAFVTDAQRHTFEVSAACAASGATPVEPAHTDYDLTAVTARTLVVSGALDIDYFTQTAAYLAETIPGASHVVLDWAGHLPSLERPDDVNRLLLEFLGERSTPSVGQPDVIR